MYINRNRHMRGVQVEFLEVDRVLEVGNMVHKKGKVGTQVVDDEVVGCGETDVDMEPELTFVVRVPVNRCLPQPLRISRAEPHRKRGLTKIPSPYLFSPGCVRHTVAVSSASGWRYST